MITKEKKVFRCKVYREGKSYKGSSEFRERLGYNGLDFDDKEIVDAFIESKRELVGKSYTEAEVKSLLEAERAKVIQEIIEWADKENWHYADFEKLKAKYKGE